MTLWAARSEHDPDHVVVSATSGSVEVKVTEDAQHVRHFWGALGRVLHEASPPAISHGQRAYEAYHAHCGGKSVHGDELPSWDEQADEIRDHWHAAASGLLGF